MAENTNKHHQPEPDNSSHVSHERTDIDIFQIGSYGVGLVVLCAVVVLMMWGMFAWLAKRDAAAKPAGPLAKERQLLPPEPRLQGVPKPQEPHVELKDLSASENAILESYGWVDSAKGTVRVPISTAIEMVAAKGLPSKPTPAGADGGFRMIPSDANGGKTSEKISQ